MTRLVCIAIAASVSFAAPAVADSYSGTLQGVVTAGTTSHSSFYPPEWSSADLTGKPITIKFNTDVFTNYTDPSSGDYFDKYVANSVMVYLANPLGDVGSSHSSITMFDYYGYADYTGNVNHGNFAIGGPLFGNEPDFWQSVSFDFSGASTASGPLHGSGIASVSFYNPFPGIYDTYNVTFELTSGSVVGTAAPEPSAWAMMIVGFGAIGGMMRRQRRTVRQLVAG